MEPIPYFTSSSDNNSNGQSKTSPTKPTAAKSKPLVSAATAAPQANTGPMPLTKAKSNNELLSADSLFAKYSSAPADGNDVFNISGPSAGQDDFFSSISASVNKETAGSFAATDTSNNYPAIDSNQYDGGVNYATGAESYTQPITGDPYTGSYAYAADYQQSASTEQTDYTGNINNNNDSYGFYYQQYGQTGNGLDATSTTAAGYQQPQAPSGYDYSAASTNTTNTTAAMVINPPTTAADTNYFANVEPSAHPATSYYNNYSFGYSAADTANNHPNDPNNFVAADVNDSHAATAAIGTYDYYGTATYGGTSYQQPPQPLGTDTIVSNEYYPGVQTTQVADPSEDERVSGEFITKVSPPIVMQQPVPRPASTALMSGAADRMDAAFPSPESRPQSVPPASAISPPPAKPMIADETPPLGSIDLNASHHAGLDLADHSAVKSSTEDELDQLVFSSASKQSTDASAPAVGSTSASSPPFATPSSVLSPQPPSTQQHPPPRSFDSVSVGSNRSRGSQAADNALNRTAVRSPDSFSLSGWQSAGSGSAPFQASANPIAPATAIGGAGFKSCPACQKRNDIDSNFCSKCGSNLVAGEPLAEATQITSPAPSNTSFTSVRSKSSSNVRRANTFSPPLPVQASAGSQQNYYNPYHPQQPVTHDGLQSQQQHALTDFVDPLGRKGCPLVSFGFGGLL